MDEDYGTDLADAQADDKYFAEKGICSLCEYNINDNGECWCTPEDNY